MRDYLLVCFAKLELIYMIWFQVVTLAVYSFFLSCVMGRQWIKPDLETCADPKNCTGEIDLVFPIFTTLQVSEWVEVYFHL